MFDDFDPSLLEHTDFKEDSVREVIILPILSRLGYRPSGEYTVVRSKVLKQPFIYVGTSKHPISIIPDYTLLARGKPVLILDAKSPSESITSAASVQQAYSYAIHPEVRSEVFALCNGRRLIVYNTASFAPLLDLAFDQFIPKWSEIERCLAPRYLLKPSLRNFAPDFGTAVLRLGLSNKADLVMVGTRLNTFMKVTDELYSASVNTELAGTPHCVSFDFHPKHLHAIVAGLPSELAVQFLQALSRAPFQAYADLVIEVDLHTHLGDPVQVDHETFVPLVIDEVIKSRFNPEPVVPEPDDRPPHIFRLGRAFRISSR
jgi:hypothetical protein